MGERDHWSSARPVVSNLTRLANPMTKAKVGSATSDSGQKTAWSGRLMMPASSLVTTLAIITIPLYRLWNASGFIMLLGLIVAGWIATCLDGVVAYLSMRSPSFAVGAPSVAVVGEPCRLEVRDAAPAGAVVDVVTRTSPNPSIRVGEMSSIVVGFDARAVWSHIGGEMTVVGPLGIIACRRRFTAAIDGNLSIGPVPGEVNVVPEAPSREESPDCTAVSRGSDLTRSLRPYRRGDTQSLVAWKASARSGELMVREVEGTAEQETVLAVQVARPQPVKGQSRKSQSLKTLSPKKSVLESQPEERSEEALCRAAGLAIAALQQGKRVRLITNDVEDQRGESGRPSRFGKLEVTPVSGASEARSAVVRNEAEVIARLAAVVPGEDLRSSPDLSDPSGPAVFLLGPNGDMWIGQDG